MEIDGRKVISLDALGSEDHIINDEITSLTLLGNSSNIKWIQKKDELVIEVPKDYESENPICFKIELEEIPSDIFGD